MQEKKPFLPLSTNSTRLKTLLTGGQYDILLNALEADGVYTVEQFHGKFTTGSLFKYLNERHLYSWKERLIIIEVLNNLLKNKEKSDKLLPTRLTTDMMTSEATIEIVVDFNSKTNYSYTYPTRIVLGGKEQKVLNWTDFIVQICEYMISCHPAEMLSLTTTPLFPGSHHIYFVNYKVNGLNSRKLSNDSWIVTNYSSTILVRMVKAICLHCKHPLDDIVTYYTKNKVKQLPFQYANSVEHNIHRKISEALNDLSEDNHIETYVKSRGLSACTINEIMATVKHPSRMRATVIRAIENNKNIVEIKQGGYIHRDSIVDMDEAAQTLLDILKTQFALFDGYTNLHLLFDAASINLSLFMNDNAFEDEVTIYNLTKHLFLKEGFAGHHFVFYGNANIWEKDPDYPLSMKGLLMYRARKAGGKITRIECESFLDKIKMGKSNFNQAVISPGDATFYQYRIGEYLLSEMLNIDDTWQMKIKKTLDELFESNSFIIPRDIRTIWYNRLPDLPMDLPWTPLLLQEALFYNQPIGYKTISAPLNQNRNTVAAAIVPYKSDYATFADIVITFLQKSTKLPRRMEAEELRFLIREAGMIEGNELIYNMHKALDDYRFAWSDENKMVFIHQG